MLAPAGGAAPAAAPEPAAEAAPVVEKTVFTVKLDKYDAAAKIKLIKEVRAITGLGLKEAKEMVERAPKIIKVNPAALGVDLFFRIEAPPCYTWPLLPPPPPLSPVRPPIRPPAI
jgi:hypothetical protein